MEETPFKKGKAGNWLKLLQKNYWPTR